MPLLKVWRELWLCLIEWMNRSMPSCIARIAASKIRMVAALRRSAAVSFNFYVRSAAERESFVRRSSQAARPCSHGNKPMAANRRLRPLAGDSPDSNRESYTTQSRFGSFT
jgi:hypothetical protein